MIDSKGLMRRSVMTASTSESGIGIQQLVATYGPAVLAAAQRILGDIHTAEDVQQEVFLKLLEKPVDDVRSWPAFLSMMATRMAIDRIRKSRRQKLFSGKWLLYRRQNITDETPSTALTRQQMAGQLREQIARLKPRDSEIFCLRCFSGMEISEIAAITELSQNYVSVILNRCQQKLATALNTQDSTQPEIAS